tara:strand:- start:238 stop:540 length:303 start_codon:yes stop_codon:yes gene_type:complete
MWHSIGKKDKYSKGDKWLVKVNGRPVGLFRYNNNYYAIKNSCLHQGYPLHEGLLCDYMIECKLHGWVFDIRDGKCLSLGNRSTKIYELRIIKDEIEIKID